MSPVSRVEGNGKVVPVLNELSTMDEDVWGSGGIASLFLTSKRD
jgi:hypothetical protein